MKLDHLILEILDETLGTQGRALGFTPDTPLLGHVPELDSMAVVSLLGAFEDKLHIVIEYDEISAANFATVGALADYISAKVCATR